MIVTFEACCQLLATRGSSSCQVGGNSDDRKSISPRRERGRRLETCPGLVSGCGRPLCRPSRASPNCSLFPWLKPWAEIVAALDGAIQRKSPWLQPWVAEPPASEPWKGETACLTASPIAGSRRFLDKGRAPLLDSKLKQWRLLRPLKGRFHAAAFIDSPRTGGYPG